MTDDKEDVLHNLFIERMCIARIEKIESRLQAQEEWRHGVDKVLAHISKRFTEHESRLQHLETFEDWARCMLDEGDDDDDKPSVEKHTLFCKSVMDTGQECCCKPVTVCKHEWATTIVPYIGIGKPTAFKTCRKCYKQDGKPVEGGDGEKLCLSVSWVANFIRRIKQNEIDPATAIKELAQTVDTLIDEVYRSPKAAASPVESGEEWPYPKATHKYLVSECARLTKEREAFREKLVAVAEEWIEFHVRTPEDRILADAINKALEEK